MAKDLEEPGFWPRGVMCRPWLSQTQLRNRWNGRHDDENQEREFDNRRSRHRLSANVGPRFDNYNRYTVLNSDVD